MALVNALLSRIARRILVKIVTGVVAFGISKINGHMGITIDPRQFIAGTFLGLDILRHELCLKYPIAAQWLS